MVETIVSRLFSQADRLGSRPAAYYHSGSFWTPVGWRQVADLVRQVAQGLVKLGQQKGDAVAILAHTRFEWLLADLGCLAAQGITVGVYATMTADQARYVIDHADVRFVFVEDKEQLEKLRKAKDPLARVEKIIVFDVTGIKLSDAVIAFDDLLERGRESSHDIDERVDAISLADPALFIYTSGTTGPPKGAVLTHGNIVAALGMLDAVPTCEDDTGLCFLPLSHSLQRIVSYHALWHGIEGRFARSLDTLAEDLLACAPTVVAAVPRIFEKVYARIQEQAAAGSPAQKRIFDWAMGVGQRASKLRQARAPVPTWLDVQYRLAKRLVFDKLRARLGGRIRIFVTGGAPIAREILEFFDAADITILEGWGMTETTATGTANLPGAQRFGSIGRPLAGVDMRLDSDGEILIRGGQVFRGYYKDDQATAESFTEDGYFRTGDIGKVDSDGYFYIVDRKKDILITAGGKNVAPQNLENLLKSDARISQVVVVGDRRPYLAALIAIAPELRQGKSESELVSMVDGIVKKRNQELASYEQIKKFRLLPADLTQESGELTPTLKVKRKVVTDKYRSLIDEMYAEGKPRERVSASP